MKSDEEVKNEVLGFINSVKNAKAIIKTLTGDPILKNFIGKIPRFKPGMIQKVLKARNTMPGRVFSTLGQISGIKGGGPNILHLLLLYYRKPRIEDEVLCDLLNKVNSPKKLAVAISIDPLFGKVMEIKPGAAKKLIQFRNSLPGKKFGTIIDVYNIAGVGIAILHHVIYSAWQKQAQQEDDQPISQGIADLIKLTGVQNIADSLPPVILEMSDLKFTQQEPALFVSDMIEGFPVITGGMSMKEAVIYLNIADEGEDLPRKVTTTIKGTVSIAGQDVAASLTKEI
jgi:hypothetical protein